MTPPKDLDKLTPEELGQLFPIIIQDYSREWSALFKIEKKLILDSFAQKDIVNIDHIGSTAIPRIKAKPTIDILLQISELINIENVKDIFISLGYQLTNQPDNPPPHMTFVKGYTKKGIKGQAYHVHIRYKGDWDEIRFRDYLINHSEIAKDYETLKLELSAKYRNDREAYTDSKSEWIGKINKLTRK